LLTDYHRLWRGKLATYFMFLFIHATELDDAYLCLVTTKGVVFAQKKIYFPPSGHKDLLGALADLLKKKGKKVSALAGICVVNGPGRFSFLRSGIILANTLGFALKILIVGIHKDDFKTKNDFIKKGLEKLKKQKKFVLVVPEYGKEPNITKPVDSSK